jgi:anti-sigma factor ChrR (cupin superfamily)
MRAFRSPRITCQEMVELVTDYFEGSLSWRDRRRFEAHLSGCDHCTEFLQQMRTTIALTGSIAGDDLSPARQDELLVLFRQWCLESL